MAVVGKSGIACRDIDETMGKLKIAQQGAQSLVDVSTKLCLITSELQNIGKANQAVVDAFTDINQQVKGIAELVDSAVTHANKFLLEGVSQLTSVNVELGDY